MLDDGKTESRSTDTLGVGFIHTVEAFAKARKMLFFNTDTRIFDLKTNSCVRFGNRNRYRATVLVILDVVADDLICYRGNDYRQLLIVVNAVESEILTDMRGDLLVNRQLFNQEHKISANIVMRSVKHFKRTLIGENDTL